MPVARSPIARGAVAGAAAATIWSAQQPLDMRVFGVRYDDVELLGTAVTRGRLWPVVGHTLHIANGAAFGAGYALVRDRLPLPAAARGPACAMAEHLGSWPLTALVPRVHPDGGRFPRLWGSGRAFAQATWRHLLFGAVLGEIERRLNPLATPEPDLAPMAPDATTVATNGHGSLDHAMRGAESDAE